VLLAMIALLVKATQLPVTMFEQLVVATD